jgi:hypothetical protein
MSPRGDRWEWTVNKGGRPHWDNGRPKRSFRSIPRAARKGTLHLQTLNTYLGESTKEIVITRVWKEILTTIEGLLIPPLSETPSDMKPLTDKEVDIVFK